MRERPADLAGVARYLLSPECKTVAILTGAGVSAAAGIPDFRSPGGMYDTLRPELITASPLQRRAMRAEPMTVVMRDMFFANAFPYLEVRRPFILGTQEHRWRATLSHRFFELLHVRTKKLARLYTQNIDGLDFQCTRLPRDKIVPVHGSIGQARCEGCGTEAPFDAFCDQVRANIKDIYRVDSTAPLDSSPINCESCHRPLVKPTTVLFGSNLPQAFFARSAEDMPSIDLLIIAGTSLVVSPANSLVYRASQEAIRLIVNDEPVGAELGIDYQAASADGALPGGVRDVFVRGDCDDVFLELMGHLGWTDALHEYAQADVLPSASQQRLSAYLRVDSG